MGVHFPAFKAYDIRGKVPTELNPDLAYRIGRAFADHTGAQRVCVGHDIRLSGPELGEALREGLNDAGVDVVRLGMVGTEMVYFATAYYGLDGGVMITASHNPPEYNGMKLVREESRPISGDTGLDEIERRAFEGKWIRSGSGNTTDRDVTDDFVKHLVSIVDPSEVKPMRVLLDSGNGAAGVVLEALLPSYPFSVERMGFEPDGTFPNGVPNPILPEQRRHVEQRLRAARSGAGEREASSADQGSFDFAVAWDGDYDRCFFFDGEGAFIEGYYIVGLLAQAFLAPGSEDPKTGGPKTIVYDPRLIWNTLDIVERYGGRAVVCKSGHAFIKEKMREVNAVYGGEMSAHHYFRDHWYCDSGMIPFLLVARLASQSGRSLGELVGGMIERYPCSGEINATVDDPVATLAKVQEHYGGGAMQHLDGLSVEFPEWRFNLRPSNTEPVIRLNVESRGDRGLMEEKTQEILRLLRS